MVYCRVSLNRSATRFLHSSLVPLHLLFITTLEISAPLLPKRNIFGKQSPPSKLHSVVLYSAPSQDPSPINSILGTVQLSQSPPSLPQRIEAYLPPSQNPFPIHHGFCTKHFGYSFDTISDNLLFCNYFDTSVIAHPITKLLLIVFHSLTFSAMV